MTAPLNLLLVDDCSDHTLKVAACLAEVPEVRIHVVSPQRWSRVRLSRYVTSFHALPPTSAPADWVAEIGRTAQHTQAVLMMPISAHMTRFLIEHQGSLPVPTVYLPTAWAFETATDKSQLADRLAEAGIPHPKTGLLSPPADLATALQNIPYPALLKATRSAFGQHIYKCDSPQAVRDTLSYCATPDQDYILQQYIQGYDIDCSVLCHHGAIQAYTIQRTLIPAVHPYLPPIAVEMCQDDTVLAITQQVMDHLQWNGIAHVDLRYDTNDGQAKVLEVNARYWGSLLGSFWAGVNFPYLAVLQALGRPFVCPTYTEGPFLVRPYPRTQQGAVRQAVIPFRQSRRYYDLADPLPATMGWLQRKRRALGRHLPSLPSNGSYSSSGR